MLDADSEQAPDRKMNDSTMPPPKTAASVSFDAGSSQTSSMPPPERPQAPSANGNNSTALRAKVPPRKKGFGLADWNRLVTSSKDLAMRRGAPLRQIKWKEIRQHNTIVDGWVVLRGKVYFLSPYLAYHPGGEKILKAVLGKDASKLFDRYHQWVNIEKYETYQSALVAACCWCWLVLFCTS
jgi:cytochrome b involved in lipid metabolism